MPARSTHAGGLFLMLAIIVGSVWGVAANKPMLGVLSGTGIGIALALLVWLLDRRGAPPAA